MKSYEECGLPVRRAEGSTPCVLSAGHRETWCQDQRALDAAHLLSRVEELAGEARQVLGVLGLSVGRGDSERWVREWLWAGKPVGVR